MEGARRAQSPLSCLTRRARRLSEEELEVLRLQQPGLIEQLAAVVTQRASCVIELEGGAPLTIRGRQSNQKQNERRHLST